MATSMLLSEDVLDRQSAAASEVREAQQRLLEAAFELSLTGIDALGQLSRSIISVLLDLTERATTTSLRSAEQLAMMIPLASDGERRTRDNSTARRPKEPAAA